MVTIQNRATRTVYDYFRDEPPPNGLVFHVQPAGYGTYVGWCVENAKEGLGWLWARHDWAANPIKYDSTRVVIEVIKSEYLNSIKAWAENLEQAVGVEVKIVVLKNAYR